MIADNHRLWLRNVRCMVRLPSSCFDPLDDNSHARHMKQWWNSASYWEDKFFVDPS